MDTLEVIIALTKTIVIMAIVFATLYICALWMKMSIDTNAKVTAIYNSLGLDTVPSDTTVYVNEGDTIRFNIMLK